MELCVIKGTQGGTIKCVIRRRIDGLVWGWSHQPFRTSGLHNSFIYFANISKCRICHSNCKKPSALSEVEGEESHNVRINRALRGVYP